MRWWAMVLVLPLVLACESTSLKPEPIADGAELFWALELNHRAVMLSTTAPYDTLRLVAAPRNYQGKLLTGLPPVQYISRDPAKVAVMPDGMLVAAAPTSEPVWVVATLTIANLKHRDSTRVKVMAIVSPPVLGSFSIHPIPPDSAKVATAPYGALGQLLVGGSFVFMDTLRARATDLNGLPLDTLGGGIPVDFRSSNPLIAEINTLNFFPSIVPGRIVGRKPGEVTIYASTTVFGITKADTLPYRIGYPIGAPIYVGDDLLPGLASGGFDRPEWKVGVGAHVWWVHGSLTTSLSGFLLNGRFGGFGTTPDPIPVPFEVDITFDDADLPSLAAADNAVISNADVMIQFCLGSAAPFTFDTPNPDLAHLSDCANAGNFVLGGGTYVPGTPPPYSFLLFATRRFNVPGTYEYRSTMRGTSGRIIVVDE